MNCQWSVVKSKETRDTDGLDASYPRGTFAVQYTETLNNTHLNGMVCITFVFIEEFFEHSQLQGIGFGIQLAEYSRFIFLEIF